MFIGLNFSMYYNLLYILKFILVNSYIVAIVSLILVRLCHIYGLGIYNTNNEIRSLPGSNRGVDIGSILPKVIIIKSKMSHLVERLKQLKKFIY